MTSLIKIGPDGDGESDDVNNEIGNFLMGPANKMMELTNIIDQPGLRRSESNEALKYMTIHQLARDGDSQGLKSILHKYKMQDNTQNKHRLKKFVCMKDEDKISALHYAARYNHVEAVKVLIEYGADVNDQDEEMATPLHYAARYKRQRIVKRNAESSDDALTNNADYVWDSKITEPTVENSVILYLLSKGAGPNLKDKYGSSPLHFAAMRGNEVATIELLQCPECNIEIEDKQHVRALHLAAAHKEVNIVEMLINKGAELGCKDEDDGTPLHFACMEGNVSIVKMIIDKAATIDWRKSLQLIEDTDTEYNTPLHLAVGNGSYDVTKYLLDHGADVNRLCKQATSPLHLAAQSGEADIVELLLEKGARIDSLNASAQTPLHIAASFNRENIAELLLKKGANINRRDRDNYSSLLLSAVYGHANVIHTLMNYCGNGGHADLQDTEKNDRTAFYLAAQEDQYDALRALMNYLDDNNRIILNLGDRYSNTPLHIAASKGYLRCIRLLLENNADLDSKNEEEQTPLHLASKSGKTNVVREIVKAGGKNVVDDEDEDSNTSLHLAALYGNAKAAQVLIEAGADIQARNTSQWTPLDCAAGKGWPKVCTILLENDAPVDPKDRIKSTPLHLASARGHTEVVKILLQWKADVTERQLQENAEYPTDNCLDLAIDNGHKDVALAIINSNKWEDALRNETIDPQGNRTTPMRKLIRKMPDVAEKVFSKCVTKKGNPEQADYSLTFNWEYLDDMYAKWSPALAANVQKVESLSVTSGSSFSGPDDIWDEDNKIRDNVKPYTTDSNVLKKNHPLTIMVQTQQEDLLGHPLVTSLLRHKWNSFGRWVYYINLGIYCVFLLFLTGYVCVAHAPYMYYDESNGNIHKGGCKAIINQKAHIKIKAEDNSKLFKAFVVYGKWIIIALAVFSLFREIIQIYHNKWQYLLGWDNLLEWITCVTSILAVIDFSKCQEDSDIRENWQWQLLAVAIFFAWMELVLFIRKLPRFGIYVVMFTDVLRTFTQFFPVFFLFIVAFALSFYCLFQNQISFKSPEASLIKTSVMMIGEFEFHELFLQGSNVTNTAEHITNLYYTGITYTIFVFFLILMSVIIMNLLVGLAVDDIKAVQDQAVLKRLAMQVELALDVERVVPEFIRKRFVVRKKNITPKLSGTKMALRSFFNFDNTFLSPSEISKTLDNDLEEIEIVQENQKKMMKDIRVLKRSFKETVGQTKRLEHMMMALLKTQNIDYQEIDIVDAADDE